MKKLAALLSVLAMAFVFQGSSETEGAMAIFDLVYLGVVVFALICWFMLNKKAGKSGWMFLLFFVPLVNIWYMFNVMIAVLKKNNRSAWLSLLLLVPLVNIIYVAILAFDSKVQ